MLNLHSGLNIWNSFKYCSVLGALLEEGINTILDLKVKKKKLSTHMSWTCLNYMRTVCKLICLRTVKYNAWRLQNYVNWL